MSPFDCVPEVSILFLHLPRPASFFFIVLLSTLVFPHPPPVPSPWSFARITRSKVPRYSLAAAVETLYSSCGNCICRGTSPPRMIFSCESVGIFTRAGRSFPLCFEAKCALGERVPETGRRGMGTFRLNSRVNIKDTKMGVQCVVSWRQDGII